MCTTAMFVDRQRFGEGERSHKYIISGGRCITKMGNPSFDVFTGEFKN
jgi:hypothetical protein